jgi:amino acid permease
MSKEMTQNKVIGGALLIAGICIGAGMLGLPVKMAPAGIL